MCILQLAWTKAHDKVRKHEEELAVVAKTEMCILELDKRINLPNILAFLLVGE